VNDFDFEIESEANTTSSQRIGNEKITPLKMKETQKQIEEAAKMANAHNFIMKVSEHSQTN
jgi:ABC-type multidrug transport system fused ATPase/permease subunit